MASKQKLIDRLTERLKVINDLRIADREEYQKQLVEYIKRCRELREHYELLSGDVERLQHQFRSSNMKNDRHKLAIAKLERLSIRRKAEVDRLRRERDRCKAAMLARGCTLEEYLNIVKGREWVDIDCAANGICSVCRHCGECIDLHPDDHSPTCPWRNFQP